MIFIEHTGSCPSRQEVLAQLERVLPAQAQRTQDRVRITLDPGGTRLRLELVRAADGSLLTRELPAPRRCDERADLVASVVAAWQTQIAGAPAQHAEARPAPRLDYDVGAALLLSFAAPEGSTFAAGGRLGARLGRAGFPLAAELGLSGLSTRRLTLGEGRADWTRAALELGASYRFAPRRWRIDLHAQALAGLVYAQGRGFEQRLRSFDADFGLGTGIRAGVRWGRVQPFLGVEVLGWLRPQRVTAAQPDPVSATLPKLEVRLSTGVCIGGR